MALADLAPWSLAVGPDAQGLLEAPLQNGPVGLQLSNTQAAITATPMTQAARHAPGVVTGRKTRATLNNVAFLVD